MKTRLLMFVLYAFAGYMLLFVAARALSYQVPLYDHSRRETVSVYVFIEPKHEARKGNRPSQVVAWRRGGDEVLHFLFCPLIAFESEVRKVMHGSEYLDAQAEEPGRFSIPAPAP